MLNNNGLIHVYLYNQNHEVEFEISDSETYAWDNRESRCSTEPWWSVTCSRLEVYFESSTIYKRNGVAIFGVGFVWDDWRWSLIFTSSYCDFLSLSREILLVSSKKFWNKMETTNLKREKTVKWKRRTRKWCLLWEKK